MPQKGWYAIGLLQPLWIGYEGGRDGLAAAVGTTGSSLSNVNSGNRRLGHDLAGRLAAELGISVLELGAPGEPADPHGVSLLGRLERVEAGMNQLGPELGRLAHRVSALEKRVPPKTGRAGQK